MPKTKVAVTLERTLLAELDELIADHRFSNRSQAIETALAETLARMLRGEIRWADLDSTRDDERADQRPVLVLSHDVFNERSGTVIAVALTSQESRARVGGGVGTSG